MVLVYCDINSTSFILSQPYALHSLLSIIYPIVPGSSSTAISVAAVAAVRRFRTALWVPTSGPQWVGVGWVPGSPVQGSSRLAPGIRRHGLVHHYG